MIIENEYNYVPDSDEVAAAKRVQRALNPSPRVEFFAQPVAAGAKVYTKVIRFFHPDGRHFDHGSERVEEYPQIAIGALEAEGFKYIPPPPAPTPVVLQPYTGMPALKPGQVMGMFGPTGPSS